MARREIPDAWQHLMAAKNLASLRDLGLAADLSHTAVAKVVHGQSKNVRDETVRALARALGVDMETIYELINRPVDYASPWSPPAESQRLTRRQRNALEELVRSMADEPKRKDDLMSNEDAAARVVASIAAGAGVEPGVTIEETIAALPERMHGPIRGLLDALAEAEEMERTGQSMDQDWDRLGYSQDEVELAADSGHGLSEGQRMAREIDNAGEGSQDPQGQP